MCRFYGWSIDDVRAMALDDFIDAELAVTAIESQEVLVLNKVGIFPNMKADDRDKVWRELHKMAYPNQEEVGQPLRTDQLAGFLNGRR